MSVAKIIEISCESPNSFEDAIKSGIARASKTVHNIKGAWVKDQQVVVEGEEEGEDPRWELIRQLVEYKKFKDAAGRLQEMEHAQENVYRRTAPKLEFEAPAQRVQVSIFDLVNAVNGILKRFAAADSRDIFEDKWTVSEKIETIVNLIRERPAVKFSELFAAATSRTEVVVTFLAMLELIRLKRLKVQQAEAFGEIHVLKTA